MKKTLIFFLGSALLLLTTNVHAQEISGGFRAGLNFSHLDGPSEGEGLESYDNSTGFHIGVIVNFALSDFFGFRAEGLYSQKGTEYRYDGDSYLRLFKQDGSFGTTAIGFRNESLQVTNSYFTIPLTAYLGVGRFEINGGVYGSVLLGSRVQGEVRLSDIRASQSPDPVVLVMDGNYFADDYSTTGTGITQNRRINSQDVVVPEVIGAYFGAIDSSEKFYRRLDYGLMAGASFYLKSGLLVGVRYVYGLADITNEAQDISRQSLDNSGNPILRDDLDRNVSIQGTIGFRF